MHVKTIPENMTIRGLNKYITKVKHSNFPIVDKDGLLTGMISFQGFKDVVIEQDLGDLIVVKELATENVITITDDKNMDDALIKIGSRNIEQLPVVDKDNPRKLIGMLSRRDIISAYNRGLLKNRIRSK